MKVFVLIDNNPHPEKDLLTEHGLSIYFEADGLKWLYDAGASEKFLINSQSLGVNIAEVDYLVLSHGHIDHTGGLEKFTEVNHKAKIIMSEQIRGKSFYSARHGVKRNIGLDPSVIENNSSRILFVDRNTQISKNVALISEFPRIYDTPKANVKLTLKDPNGERKDEFRHESALAVNSPGGLIVFSGCSHNGILNVLYACSDYYSNSKIIVCLGGTHLINSDSSNIYESPQEITSIGKSILNKYPGMRLITGHCTGSDAINLLELIMGNKLKTFYSGAVIDI